MESPHLQPIAVGMTIELTSAYGKRAGHWRILATSGWGSRLQSARLVKVRRDGRLHAAYGDNALNLDPRELARLGLCNEFDTNAEPEVPADSVYEAIASLQREIRAINARSCLRHS